MEAQVKKERKNNPRENANILSVLIYSWILKIFWTGFQRDLEIEDLPKTLKEHQSNYLGNKISHAWKEELKRVENKNINSKNENTTPNLTRVLFQIFGVKFFAYGIIFSILLTTTRTIQPLLLAEFIKYFSNSSSVTKKQACIYAGGMLACVTIGVFVMRCFLMGMNHMGMKIRIACCSLMYRKVLKLSGRSLNGTIVGQTVNIMSNDVSRFDSSMIFLHFIWIGPLQTIFSTYFIYREVGWAGVIGVFCFLLMIPFTGWIGKKSIFYRRKSAEKTDERVRLTNEIITGIQAIKMYSWEYPFSNLINDSRNAEINAIRSTYNLRLVLISLSTFMSKVILFITMLGIIFLTNDGTALGIKNITATNIFMLIAYFESLRLTMLFSFPRGILLLSETIVAIKRIQEFMMYEEVQPELQKHPEIFVNHHIENIVEENDEKNNSLEKIPLKGSITIEGAHARWSADDSEDTLSNLNIRVKPGQLVAVVGQVGSGKSSLLNVILKELAVYLGSVDVRGNIAYACQEPWLFAGSVRNNILFGRTLDQKRYEQVVKVCQLKRDFQLFPYGDKTIVGERGVSLSGGQRARINLARAVYADAPIYLLDDPLSAVDAHVGKHMFEECIEKYLKGKTRILVTHQIQFLRNVEKIIVMKDGKIEAEGSYNELTSRGIDFGSLSVAPSKEDDTASLAASQTTNSRRASFDSVNSIEIGKTANDSLAEPVEVEETRSRGSMGVKIYLTYFSAACNICLVLSTALVAIGTQAFASGSEYFVSYWVKLEEKFPNSTLTDSQRSLSTLSCIGIFTILIVATIILTFIRSFTFISVCMRASKNLHNEIFKNLSRATMRFFTTNPSGRILNRFSKDLGTVDDLMPPVLLECIQNFLKIIGIFIVVAIINIWLLIPAVVVGIIIYFIKVFYFATSRSIKRLEGVTKSPVFNHLSATCQGLTTIRSLNSENNLIKEFDNHQDLHSSAWYIFIACSTAFAFWLDLFCLIYVAVVTVSFLGFMESDGISGGDVGLIFTQIIGLTGLLQFTMRQSAELENHMTSVERVYEYTNLESEPALESLPDKKPKSEWPEGGKIVFKNVQMSYDPLEAPVLKNLNFTIKEKEKVGIVGRTGAGKSSLISALFRLAHLEGKIEIDGIDTGDIGLHDLRSKISIIPQEPFLFSGSLRRNLDPFNSYEDCVLWSALEDVELKEMGLQAHVNEGGSNLSVGQRQLICLARAIIRNNRILILDEATANVDPRTDELIQKTIRRKFSECTVLTIAHRLNTVMDSDKILVMDAGTVTEFDHPHVLLQNPDGALSSMISETGKAMADALTVVARENYQATHQRPSTTSL